MNAAAWPGEGSPRGSLIFPGSLESQAFRGGGGELTYCLLCLGSAWMRCLAQGQGRSSQAYLLPAVLRGP